VGTGHDFLNRHSCNNGLMIRTNFLNEMDWSKDGVVKLGSGLTFSDISKAGSEQTPSAYVSTGWAGTVGVAGWSIGGGHGPNANANGIGVDNVLGVEIVTADGNLVTANSTHNTDLFWALKGGGGSTWGVMTALYIKKHITPPGGFSSLQVAWLGQEQKQNDAVDRSSFRLGLGAF
jgi:FAD/FMN-containing dehydrogenase